MFAHYGRLLSYLMLVVVALGLAFASLPVGSALAAPAGNAGSDDGSDGTEYVSEGPVTTITSPAPGEKDVPSVASAQPCTVFARIHWWHNSDSGRGKVVVHAIKGGDCRLEVRWRLTSDFGEHSLAGETTLTEEDTSLNEPV